MPEGKRLLEAEIVQVSREHPTLGYKKVAAKLRSLGYRANKKMVQRFRCEEGLQVPPRRPRKRRQGLSTGLPQKAVRRNHVWAWDFVSDYTQRGGKLRAFNLIDEFTRECHCIHADRAIKAPDVLALLQKAIGEHGAPNASARTTAQSSSPRPSSNGSRAMGSRLSISTPDAHGRTDTPRASTADSGRSAWTAS